MLAADCWFDENGFFYTPFININTATLEKLFIHKIFKMLLFEGFIIERIIVFIEEAEKFLEITINWLKKNYTVF
jgi:hypothetical protein